MNLELINKTALISGSTKGIGFAIASQLASEGARVISTEKTVEDLLTSFPAVDILVNNLGIYGPKPFEEITDEEWRRFFEINVLSGVRLSRAYVSGMKERKWGRVIFISSESALNTPKEMVHYGMTKTAQLAVSRGLAESCAGTGVTVNAILPGPTHSAGLGEFVNQLSEC